MAAVSLLQRVRASSRGPEPIRLHHLRRRAVARLRRAGRAPSVAEQKTVLLSKSWLTVRPRPRARAPDEIDRFAYARKRHSARSTQRCPRVHASAASPGFSTAPSELSGRSVDDCLVAEVVVPSAVDPKGAREGCGVRGKLHQTPPSVSHLGASAHARTDGRTTLCPIRNDVSLAVFARDPGSVCICFTIRPHPPSDRAAGGHGARVGRWVGACKQPTELIGAR